MKVEIKNLTPLLVGTISIYQAIGESKLRSLDAQATVPPSSDVDAHHEWRVNCMRAVDAVVPDVSQTDALLHVVERTPGLLEVEPFWYKACISVLALLTSPCA